MKLFAVLLFVAAIEYHICQDMETRLCIKDKRDSCVECLKGKTTDDVFKGTVKSCETTQLCLNECILKAQEAAGVSSDSADTKLNEAVTQCSADCIDKI
ncbi:Uncharacterised protein g1461 [Pycnogonum litorale]